MEKGEAAPPSGPGVQYLTNKSTIADNANSRLFERAIDDGHFKLVVAVNGLGRIIISINDASVTVLAEDGLEAVWHELILAGAFRPAVDQHVRFKLLNNISFMYRDAITWLEEAQKHVRAKHESKVLTLAELFKEESEK
ncbi:MAG: hypothetical protein JRN37_06415 [Nitrososphaerota archaeon]|jgi:hypothetical protein|nr:hypothetical protein [Nitrososphaerota archaeon]